MPSPPGRNPSHASVAATEGLLELMNDDELEGVIAHELSHVRNYDILTTSIAATLAGAITWIASMGRWAMLFGGFGGDRDRRGGGAGSSLDVDRRAALPRCWCSWAFQGSENMPLTPQGRAWSATLTG